MGTWGPRVATRPSCLLLNSIRDFCGVVVFCFVFSSNLKTYSHVKLDRFPKFQNATYLKPPSISKPSTATYLKPPSISKPSTSLCFEKMSDKNPTPICVKLFLQPLATNGQPVDALVLLCPPDDCGNFVAWLGKVVR